MGKRSCVTLVEELIRQRDQARDEAHADRKSNYVLALENKYLKERLYGPNTHPAAIASLKEMLEFFLQQENSQILSGVKTVSPK